MAHKIFHFLPITFRFPARKLLCGVFDIRILRFCGFYFPSANTKCGRRGWNFLLALKIHPRTLLRIWVTDVAMKKTIPDSKGSITRLWGKISTRFIFGSYSCMFWVLGSWKCPSILLSWTLDGQQVDFLINLACFISLKMLPQGVFWINVFVQKWACNNNYVACPPQKKVKFYEVDLVFRKPCI